MNDKINNLDERTKEEQEHYINFMSSFSDFFKSQENIPAYLIPDFMMSIAIAFLADAGISSKQFNEMTKNLNKKYEFVIGELELNE